MNREKVRALVPKVDSVLWTYSSNKEGLHPVKIRVLYNREYKYYPVQWESKKLFLSKADGDHILETDKKKLKGKNREIKERIDSIISAAYAAIEKITTNGRQFNFERFKRNFVHESVSDGFFSWYEKYLYELKADQRVGSYNAYNNALQALKKFRDDRDLNPSEITPQFLKEFEKNLLKKVSETTVGIYMRALKVIYNFAADEFPQLKDDYPFATKQNDKRRYKIGTTSSTKGEALSPELLKRFIDTKTQAGSPEHEAKLYWLFSFYCQGMNMRDIALQRQHNIEDDTIRYTRKKTSTTTKDRRLIEVPLAAEAKSIIAEIGNPDKNPNAYIFNILTPGLDPFKQDAVVKQKTKQTNKWLKRLCEANKLPVVTTYWARHTYASLMKFAGVQIELIRELLGHGDLRTTETYLKRFDIDKKRKANELLKGFMER